MSTIFLSHSSKDNEIAEQVKARLEQWGHRSVFLDFDPDHGIPPGRDWEKELYAKLRECRVVIAICSHASMASRWCFAEITHAKAQGKPVISIRVDQVQLDFILAKDQVIDASAGWEHVYHHLEKGLIGAGLDPKDQFAWDNTRPPYPGLLALEEQDAAIYFGREKEIREGLALLTQLRNFGGPPLTVMLGASGSGKSSLMRAGLLPRLKRDPQWLVIGPFRPLKAPFDELARAMSQRFDQDASLQQRLPIDVRYVQDRLQWQQNNIVQVVEAFLQLIEELREKVGLRNATVLLMIDQGEELLAIGGENEENLRFLRFLLTLLDRANGHVLLLATVRPDFLASFYEFPALRGLRYNTIQVPQMKVEDFALLIEGPARLAGLELETGLVQAMVHDTETSHALPLLAFTLRELYEGYGGDNLLTVEEYKDKLKGLKGCIARTAEAVLNAKPLSEHELSDLQTGFLLMVRVNEQDQYAKQPAQWTDMPSTIHELLERFVKARLLIASSNEGGRTLEVAHEALFRDWLRLKSWLSEEATNLKAVDAIKRAAVEWKKENNQAWLLHAGERLATAEALLQRKNGLRFLGECASDYLVACRAREELVRVERETMLQRELNLQKSRTEAAEEARKAAEEARKAAEEARQAHLERAKEAERARQYQVERDAARRRPVLALAWFGMLVIVGVVSWMLSQAYQSSVNKRHFKQAAAEICSKVGSAEYNPCTLYGFPVPRMVTIPVPAGIIHKVKGSDGKTQRVIDIQEFQLSEHEITFELYELFATATGKDLPLDSGWPRGKQPVINVSWEEASEYAAWLTKMTGQPFSLPTEVQWQYAAQTGEKQEVWAGTNEIDDLRKYAVYSDSEMPAERPAPVKSKLPNSFRLYDMSGNVHEWVQDCYGDKNDEDLSSGRRHVATERLFHLDILSQIIFKISGISQKLRACEHLIRGGAWQYGPNELTTFVQDRMHSGSRSNDVGFRVALNKKVEEQSASLKIEARGSE